MSIRERSRWARLRFLAGWRLACACCYATVIFFAQLCSVCIRSTLTLKSSLQSAAAAGRASRLRCCWLARLRINGPRSDADRFSGFRAGRLRALQSACVALLAVCGLDSLCSQWWCVRIRLRQPVAVGFGRAPLDRTVVVAAREGTADSLHSEQADFSDAACDRAGR